MRQNVGQERNAEVRHSHLFETLIKALKNPLNPKTYNPVFSHMQARPAAPHYTPVVLVIGKKDIVIMIVIF